MNDFIVITENTEPNIVSIENSSSDPAAIVEIEVPQSPTINILGPSDLEKIKKSMDTGGTK